MGEGMGERKCAVLSAVQVRAGVQHLWQGSERPLGCAATRFARGRQGEESAGAALGSEEVDRLYWVRGERARLLPSFL